METLEYDHHLFDPVNMQAAKADENLAVRFYMFPLHDEEASVLAGRPQYKDTPMIEIRVRGDRNNIINRPVRPEDKPRFAAAYRAFEKNEEMAETGTSLREWPIMSRSMVEELKYFGFHTVEQLAGASDGVIGKFAGLGTWKQKAILYLEQSKGGAPIEGLLAENASLKSAQEMLQRQVTEMAAQIAAMDKLHKAAAK